MYRSVTGLLIFIFALTTAHGQQTDLQEPETVQQEYDLEEIVVTAFNVSRRLLTTTGSLTMISPRQIHQERAINMMPLLNQASGVFAHSGTLSTSRVTIRGIGSRVPYGTGKIRAYLNNIPLTNGSGITILEQIDPSVIERIEVIKGPATSAYGAGLGGTINMTARQPSERTTGVNNAFQAGSFGLINNSFLVDHGGETLASSLVINRAQSDGFRENNKYFRNAFTSVTQFKAGKRTDGTVLIYLSDTKGYIPSSIDSITFRTNPRVAAQNWMRARGFNETRLLLAGASGSHRFGKGFKADVSIFSTLHDEMERRPFDFLYEDRRSAGARIKGSWTRIAGLNQWVLMAGGEVFFEDFSYRNHENIDGIGNEGEIISRNNEKIHYRNIFIQADADLGNLYFSAGLNANTNQIDFSNLIHAGGIDRSGNYNYGVILSPRISANYRYHSHHAVFATISHGFAPPSLSETLTPDGFINPDIRPEKSWSFETGLRGSFWNKRMFYDLSVYHMHIENLLVAQRVGEDAWVGRNAGRSVHQGLEMEIQGSIYESPGSQQSFWQVRRTLIHSSLSLNHYFFTDFVDNDVDYSGNRIPGVPPAYWNGDLRLEFSGGLYAVTGLRYTAGMPMNDANSRDSDAYTVFGAMAGFQRQFNRWNLDLFFKVDNLFDTHYASMILVNAPSFGNAPPRYYYPGYPRNFTVGLRIGFER